MRGMRLKSKVIPECSLLNTYVYHDIYVHITVISVTCDMKATQHQSCSLQPCISISDIPSSLHVQLLYMHIHI